MLPKEGLGLALGDDKGYPKLYKQYNKVTAARYLLIPDDNTCATMAGENVRSRDSMPTAHERD